MNKTTIIIITVCFSFLVVLYSAILQTEPEETIKIHYDAPFWIAMQCFCAQWLTAKFHQKLTVNSNIAIPTSTHYIKVFVLSNLCFVFPLTVLTLLIEWAFGYQEIDKSHILALTISLFLLHTLNGGAVIALKLIENLNFQQLDLELTKKALLENQVKQLQKQLDPHFLFNNLNTLSALIISKPEMAENYLDTFTNIYRYVFDSQKLETITLDQEISFAQDYMSLLNQRFAGAYHLSMDYKRELDLEYLTLPCSLQLALENVIKHNQGDKENPLPIKVEINGAWLNIHNKIRPKSYVKASSGFGLKNLEIRSRSILGKPIELNKTASDFTLKIPLIRP
ncbi:sensor histidine kinase [Microbulbifer sp. GL-2]|uniref:sensor histidine kinase n=1 Tax=Microbulbifer sp. GL-2 TaxID=2591606 RepID=UPI00117CF87E|nr:sensor histidine kinase [Microbulbifer sp. GL-2]